MKILIHGRKNGYTVLYPKPTPAEFYSFASDIQSISASNDGIYYDKKFYTLAFVDGGSIFTKYVFGDDVERGQLGEIGISIFIPNNQKLPGSEVKSLLDELVNIYRHNYIVSNQIIEPKNGFDWLLFTSSANCYDSKLQPCSSSNYNNVTAGTQDPAFHYYKSDSELIEHLDKPFQEEYNDYRQILFIDSSLQGAANPLNVLKKSGVEVNPDLKNDCHYLNNYNHSKGVKISAYYNNKWNERSDRKGNNQIRAKWNVKIEYLKPYYDPIEAEGTISNLDSDIHKYLEIKSNDIKIKYDAIETDSKSKPAIKKIEFRIKDWNDNPIKDAEIKIEGVQNWAKIDNYTFKGEDIGKQYKISARKENENLYLDTVPVIPDQKNDPVILTLKKQKTIKIFATDKEDGNNISNFSFWCNDGKGLRENVKEITFRNGDIEKTWIIEVSKKEKSYHYHGIEEKYCPATGENPLYIKCQKKENQQSNNETGEVDEDKRGEQKSVKQKITKFFSPKVIANSVVGILILCIGIWALCHYKPWTWFVGQTVSPDKKSEETKQEGNTDTRELITGFNANMMLIIGFVSSDYKDSEAFKEKIHNDRFFPNLGAWMDEVCKDTPQTTGSNTISGNSSVDPPAPPTSPEINKTSEIIQYIKGSELDEEKLKEYKNAQGISDTLKKSIQLCLDFWTLDGSGSGKNSKTYWSFREKVNADNNFKGSKLKVFLDKACKEQKTSYSKQDKKRGLK